MVLLGASCATQPGTLVLSRKLSWMLETSMASGRRRNDLTQHLLPGEEIVLTPHGAEQYRAVDHSKFPGNTCMPYGPNRGMAATNPYIIVQTPEVIAVVTGHIDYRIFYMNAEHPADIKDYPEWMGSTGRWEGDTLIVDKVGTRPESWLIEAVFSTARKCTWSSAFRKLDRTPLRGPSRWKTRCSTPSPGRIS